MHHQHPQNHISFIGFSCTVACSLHLLHLYWRSAATLFIPLLLFRFDVIHQLMTFKQDAVLNSFELLKTPYLYTCILCVFVLFPCCSFRSSVLFFVCFFCLHLALLSRINIFDLYSHFMINFLSL